MLNYCKHPIYIPEPALRFSSSIEHIRKSKGYINSKRPHEHCSLSYNCLLIMIKGLFDTRCIRLFIADGIKLQLTRGFWWIKLNSMRNLNSSYKSLVGLYARMLSGEMNDLSFLYWRYMVLNGVGFRAFTRNTNTLTNRHSLLLSIGYSYVVIVSLNDDVRVYIKDVKGKSFAIAGLSRAIVNDIVHIIRCVHPPDEYCGQGILTAEEMKQLVLKPGKRQAQHY